MALLMVTFEVLVDGILAVLFMIGMEKIGGVGQPTATVAGSTSTVFHGAR